MPTQAMTSEHLVIIFYFYLPLAAAEKWNTYLLTYLLTTYLLTYLLTTYLLQLLYFISTYIYVMSAAAAAADGDDDGDRTEKSGFV